MDKFEVLKRYFGYDAFREGQEELIDTINAGRDVLGIMPTGAGKSLCYQIPAVMAKGVAVIVSPLISLMKDQVGALNQAGIRACYLNSSLTYRQYRLALQYAAEGRYQIAYVAPERLMTPEFLAFAQQAEIHLLCVDETHCVSQWGHDFRPEYARMGFLRNRLIWISRVLPRHSQNARPSRLLRRRRRNRCGMTSSGCWRSSGR